MGGFCRKSDKKSLLGPVIIVLLLFKKKNLTAFLLRRTS